MERSPTSLPPRGALRRRALPLSLVLVALLAACVDLPKIEEALENTQDVAQTTKVYAADGSLIAELHAEENREVIALGKVPRHVVDAVLAIEDARFYEHAGIDYQGILRALTRNVSAGRVVEGGSTITQQLIKTTTVGNERSLKRKLNEAILAFQIEQKLSKDEILEKYLNTVYFGRGAYGIQAAAHVFFNKPARRLTLPEGALLAGQIRAPGRFDPSDLKAARFRRTIVLRRMLEEGMITEAQYDKARTTRIVLSKRPNGDQRYRYGYFIEYVKQQLFESEQFAALGETRADRIAAVFKGGLRIYTTLDPGLQRQAERNARQTLPYRSDPYTAFVGVKPDTGAVVSMVGGRGYFGEDRFAKLNLAVRRRQPGSAFKPFTLIAAIEKGIPLTRIYRGGSQISLRLPNGQVWSPANYGFTSFGSSLSLLRATAYSVNVVYAQVVVEVGPDKVVNVARRMGITSPIEPVYAISLGTEEVSPVEMAQAYAVLANNGVKVPLTPVARITDAAGRTVYQHEPKGKRVLAEPVAALATEALQEVMEAGTGSRLPLGRPAAGKTGTSENYADAWFAGYTPDYVGVAWVGFPEGQIGMTPPRTRIRVYGSSWPGQMWQSWMLYAHRGLASTKFPVAEDLFVKVRVDTLRNCLPNQFTPPYLIEERSYLKGSEPTERCTEPTSGVIPSTPEVIGEPSSEARTTLLRAGFAVSTVSQDCPAFDAGVVCDQYPDPGTRSRVGTQAVIYVSTGAGEAEVPVVLGRTLERARQKLQQYGYEVRVVTRSNDDGYDGCRDIFEEASGRVWLQTPCGGASYPRGKVVTIYVNP